jgi:hypothetical protein
MAQPAPSATPSSAPPSSDVAAALLADARQTRDDLMQVKVWFDRMAGSESVSCATVIAHTIHLPSSTAPGQVPQLASPWNEYQAAIADGQQCLQWLKDFCVQGGGTLDVAMFNDRRSLSASALSRCEHAVQALESGQ